MATHKERAAVEGDTTPSEKPQATIGNAVHEPAGAHLAVGLDDVLAARKLLADVVRPTPLAWSRPLSEQLGGEVWFKCENVQRAGSFKIRGAYVHIHNLPPHERAR